MSITHKLSYTATEIDEKLGKVDKAVLFNRQSLTEEEKAQARANIGSASAEEIGDISTALDELHAYAEALKGGVAE